MKRKLTIALLIALLTAALLAANASADNGFVIENNVLKKYTGPGGSVSIPYGVTEISERAFDGCTNVTSITIPSTVTTIGNCAFIDCVQLTSVTIPNGVDRIQLGTFYNCVSLESITLPVSVKKIGSDAFNGCSSLSSVTISGPVTDIGNSCFAGCKSLQSIQLPDTLMTLGDYAFAACSQLERIVIPSGVTSIGSGTFNGCESLSYVALPSGLKSIGEIAFFSCKSLTSIDLPSGLTTIKSGAFEYCTNLYGISFPSSLRVIESYAFKYCFGLEELLLPSSLTAIADSAFSYCQCLENVSIPSSITSIGSRAFEACNRLTRIDIPDSVTFIGQSAFYDCTRLLTIVLPSSITGFGADVFENCGVLTAEVDRNSTAHIYCESNLIPYRLNEPQLISAAFATSTVNVGSSVEITVLTNNKTDKIVMCSENGTAVKTWTEGYAESDATRLWKVSYTFSGAGNRTLYFKAGKGNQYSEPLSAKITVKATPNVTSASFASSATVGKAVGLTVKTNTAAKYVRMYAENGSAVKTWSSGYTDSGNVRTWNLSYTFSGAGSRILTFKVSADNTGYTGSVKAKVTVSNAVRIDSVKFDSSATVGKAVGITVTTPTSVKYIAMCSSNGAAYKTWSSGYTDSGTTRTWKVNYTFSGSGNRTMYFKASANNSSWSSLVSASVTVSKPAVETKVTSAVFNSSAIIGQSVGITVKTTTAAKYVRMYAENGSAVKTWSSGYTDSGDVRTWSIAYSFSGSGYRSLTFKASADNSKYDAGFVTKVAVNPAVPVVSSASFAASSAKVNQSVGITVKTGSNATVLALCSENGSVVRTWAASGNSSVSGNVRTWSVSYAFGGAGNRSIGFKASANGSTYGSIVKASITINK